MAHNDSVSFKEIRHIFQFEERKLNNDNNFRMQICSTAMHAAILGMQSAQCTVYIVHSQFACTSIMWKRFWVSNQFCITNSRSFIYSFVLCINGTVIESIQLHFLSETTWTENYSIQINCKFVFIFSSFQSNGKCF